MEISKLKVKEKDSFCLSDSDAVLVEQLEF